MKIKFWGTRGSLPTPGPSTLLYGGNSACVEVRTDDGQLIVLDCGTGIRALGQALLATEQKPLVGHLLVSHTHWDHIQGFPFFGPIYVPGNAFTIYSGRATDKPLKAVFSGQLDYLYFPVNLRQLPATMEFRELGEEAFRIGEATVRTMTLNHTTLTLGYRIESRGRSIAYITDHEPYSRYYPKWGITGGLEHPAQPPATNLTRRSFVHEEEQRLADFIEGVDILIQDAQYLEEEYASHVGWGHGSVDYALDMAVAAKVGQLVFFHHDPSHEDGLLSAIEAQCRDLAQTLAPDLEVSFGAEGKEINLDPAREITRIGGRKPRVLVVEDDPDVVGILEYILREDGNEPILATDGEQGIAKALAEVPDLILLDVMMPVVDGYQVCQALRANAATRRIPIIMLTGKTEETDAERGFRDGVNDYMTKPFAPAQVRARTRSWLLRSGTLADQHQT